jgi:hypothetical protein
LDGVRAEKWWTVEMLAQVLEEGLLLVGKSDQGKEEELLWVHQSDPE